MKHTAVRPGQLDYELTKISKLKPPERSIFTDIWGLISYLIKRIKISTLQKALKASVKAGFLRWKKLPHITIKITLVRILVLIGGLIWLISSPSKQLDLPTSLTPVPKALNALKAPVLQPQSKLDSVYIVPPIATETASSFTDCGSDPYMAYIYQKESGCSTTAINPQGCYGLGQDCNGVVENLCGSDWACQNSYFEQYAVSRYGSTYLAMLAWQSQGWW